MTYVRSQRWAYICLEYCAGGDLYTAIGRDVDDKLSWYQRGRRIAIDISYGLAYLHGANIAHLDIKVGFLAVCIMDCLCENGFVGNEFGSAAPVT